MIQSTERCPFREGDLVVYKPSRKGRDLDVMSAAAEKLTEDAVYRVRTIQNHMYIIVEGYTHPGGGIHWTEFRRANV